MFNIQARGCLHVFDFTVICGFKRFPLSVKSVNCFSKAKLQLGDKYLFSAAGGGEEEEESCCGHRLKSPDLQLSEILDVVSAEGGCQAQQ